MVMRISDNMKFDTVINNLFSAQEKYNDLMEKVASEKTINRPSDDPLGLSIVMKYRESQSAVVSYQCNVDTATGWINMSESKLSAVDDLLINAREIAVAQSNATMTAESRETSAVMVQQIIDELSSIANSKYGNNYLFAGTKMDGVPFSSSSRGATAIGTATAAADNTFDGTVASGGTYTGSVNKTYVVKIVTGGAFADAEYKVSSDGGKTWSATNDDLDTGTITIGEGIDLTFTAGAVDLAVNDVFYVNGFTDGYYNGNGEELSVEIGKDTTLSYSISGEDIFTDKGDGTVDIFEALNDLKTALENNSPTDIAAQIDNLKAGSEQVNKCIAKCGILINRLEFTDSSLTDLDYGLTELISKIEDVDITEIITKFSMQEIVLEATYTMASKVGNISILNFIG